MLLVSNQARITTIREGQHPVAYRRSLLAAEWTIRGRGHVRSSTPAANMSHLRSTFITWARDLPKSLAGLSPSPKL
jgi:hypothetical protein